MHGGVAQEDDGGGLDNVGPAACNHGLEGKEQRGDFILGQLDDEERLAVLVTGNLVDQQSAQEDQDNAGKIHGKAHPTGIIKECAGKEGDDRDLGAAGHKGCQHGGGTALPLIADGTAGHNAGDGTAGADDKGDDGLTGQAHLLEDGVQHHGDTGHVAAVLQQCDEEVHNHDKRQEADHGAHAADDTIGQQSSQQRIGICQRICNESLEGFDPAHQRVSDQGSHPGLGNLEHQEHDHGKNGNAQELVGEDSVDGIAGAFVTGENFPLLHLRDQLIHKGKSLAVRLFHDFFVGQINIALGIGSLLLLTLQGHGGIHHGLQAVGGNGYRFQNRAAQLGSQTGSIDGRLLFGIDIALIQCHNDRDAQFQQLGGKKQAAAEVGGIHDVNNDIRVLMAHIRAGNTLLRGERRHGIRAGQVYCNQFFRTATVGFLNGMFFLFHRDAGPVAHLLITPGQGIIHGGLAGVGVACQGNTHG